METSDLELQSAGRYSLEELTDAYNETRVDYLVPMPLNVRKLAEYVQTYDVLLKESLVALSEEMIMGLGMLGVRGKRGWITRLGVLPYGRRLGTGTAIMNGLIDGAARLGCEEVWLEVIKGNGPGTRLFDRFGFQPTRELIVARRPPDPHTQIFPSGVKQVTPLDHEPALQLLAALDQRPNWLRQVETMRNLHNLSALAVELEDGGRGWVCFHADLMQITRVTVNVVAGDPTEVTATILRLLHRHFKRQDAKVENLPDDEIWQGFRRAGYFESFRRVEMVKQLT